MKINEPKIKNVEENNFKDACRDNNYNDSIFTSNSEESVTIEDAR